MYLAFEWHDVLAMGASIGLKSSRGLVMYGMLVGYQAHEFQPTELCPRACTIQPCSKISFFGQIIQLASQVWRLQYCLGQCGVLSVYRAIQRLVRVASPTQAAVYCLFFTELNPQCLLERLRRHR